MEFVKNLDSSRPPQQPRTSRISRIVIANVLGAFLFVCAVFFAQEAITFTHTQRSLRPGEIILFKSKSSYPLAQMILKAFGKEFPAFSDNGGLDWTGLVGIDLDTKPGSYTVALSGTGQDGRSVTATGTLVVSSREFPTRRLSVEEKYVSPPPGILTRIEAESKRVNSIFSSETKKRLWKGPFGLPVPGAVISGFGKRSVYNGKPRSPHTGVDFRGGAGTPIRAPNSGIVVLAAELYYSGNTMIIDHGQGLYSYLGHMSSFSVQEGDHVESGEVVGKIGATGLVTGPHLHWTIRLINTRVDPLSLVALFKK